MQASKVRGAMCWRWAIASTLAVMLPAASAWALPAGAQPPSLDWLHGTWVNQGSKCSEFTAAVYLPDGRLGMVEAPAAIRILGRWNLRGDILTSVVESEQYGDLINKERIGRAGPNDMALEPVSKGGSILPRRRCPQQAGAEPWFPRVRFKGMAAYTSIVDARPNKRARR